VWVHGGALPVRLGLGLGAWGMAAVKLSGVPGLLTQKTLSPASLADSSTPSAPAEMALAMTNVGRYFSSGKMRLSRRAPALEWNRFDSVRCLMVLAAKNCVYSVSLSVLADEGLITADGASAAKCARAVWCCSVAERWWLVAGRRNEGRSSVGDWTGVSYGTRVDEDRLTSLLGGMEGWRLPVMGAVEPAYE
jgi:hypothetical protein